MSWNERYDSEVVQVLRERKQFTPTSEESLMLRDKAANIVLKHFRPELQACVRAWRLKFNIDESDGESLIYDNLLKSLDWFDADKTAGKFTTFFWHVNSCFFKNFLTHTYAKKRTPQVQDLSVEAPHKRVFQAVHSLSSPAPFHKAEGYETHESLENTIPEPYRLEQSISNKLLLERVATVLTPLQRRILKRVAIGYTLTDIGRRIHLPFGVICGEMRKIKEKAQTFTEDLT